MSGQGEHNHSGLGVWSAVVCSSKIHIPEPVFLLPCSVQTIAICFSFKIQHLLPLFIHWPYMLKVRKWIATAIKYSLCYNGRSANLDTNLFCNHPRITEIMWKSQVLEAVLGSDNCILHWNGFHLAFIWRWWKRGNER